MSTPEPFQINIPQADLDDLRSRLQYTRWPDEQPGIEWQQGIPRNTMRELVGYWVDGFDWRSQEQRLNSFDQITTIADGAHVHAVHARADDPNAPALLLLHGWPSSFADYIDILQPLRKHFHLVVPSLPGFAFSGPTPGPGWGSQRMVGAMAALMDQLGYRRFGVHGTDLGAMVGRRLGIDYPDRITIVHTGGIVGGPGNDDELTDNERARGAGRGAYMTKHSGYAMQQSQAPQTLGYALTDSPAGQLAWIAEKLMSAWPDPQTPIDQDAILTTVSIYWFTATAASSARVYWEGGRDLSWFQPLEPSNTPTAVAYSPTAPHKECRSAASPNASTRSPAGPNTTAADTSPFSKSPNSSSTTCLRPSAENGSFARKDRRCGRHLWSCPHPFPGGTETDAGLSTSQTAMTSTRSSMPTKSSALGVYRQAA